MTLAFRWDVVFDIVFVYSWAVAAGLVLGITQGWTIGLIAMVIIAALLHAVERGAKAWIRKSRQTHVPQRRFPTQPE